MRALHLVWLLWVLFSLAFVAVIVMTGSEEWAQACPPVTLATATTFAGYAAYVLYLSMRDSWSRQ